MALKGIDHVKKGVEGGKPFQQGHVDFVYREKDQEPKVFNPLEMCNLGCFNPLMKKLIATCTPFNEARQFSASCNDRCEKIVRKINFGIIPTETDHPQLYYLLGASLGSGLLGEMQSDFHFNQCFSVALLPAHQTASEEVLQQAGERVAAMSAFAIFTLSLLTFGRVAMIQKARQISSLVAKEVRLAKATYFLNA